MARLTGRDIRMHDFRRTLLGRGYRRADVDHYLTGVAVEVDRMHEARHIAEPVAAEPEPRENFETSHLLLENAREVAAKTVDDARAEANDIVARAQREATELHRKVTDAGDGRIDAARTEADDILDRARTRAEHIVDGARAREQQAARMEAEVELRLAHTERKLAERADALVAEAHRLETLADWLAAHDLRAVDLPDDLDGEGAPQAPSGDVVRFRRAD